MGFFYFILFLFYFALEVHHRLEIDRKSVSRFSGLFFKLISVDSGNLRGCYFLTYVLPLRQFNLIQLVSQSLVDYASIFKPDSLPPAKSRRNSQCFIFMLPKPLANQQLSFHLKYQNKTEAGQFPLDELQQNFTVKANQWLSFTLEAVSVTDKVHLDVTPVISSVFVCAPW